MAKEVADFVARGGWGEVRYAARANGSMEAKDWLDGAGKRVQSKFDHLFRKISGAGKIANTEQFRSLSSGIWEFKRDGHRILCFQHGDCWWLTHHYAKSGPKCPRREIDRAIEIRGEHLTRAAKGKR